MRRDNVIQIRVSTERKEELARRAAEAGTDVTGFIYELLGWENERGKRKPSTPKDLTQRMIASALNPPGKPDPLEARITELARTMPRSNAERLARKELQ